MPPTLAAMAESTTAGTLAAGTTTTARSIGPGTSSSRAYAVTPSQASALGLIGITSPVNRDRRLPKTAAPMPPW